MSDQFRQYDASALDQVVSIDWQMVTRTDETAGTPEERDQSFWPSRDPDAAGYVEPEHFDEAQAKADAQMEAFNAGDWEYVGVLAVASVTIPIGAGSFRTYVLESAGLWGVESDADDDYLASVFTEEKGELQSDLKALAEHVLADELAKLRAIASAAMACDIGAASQSRLTAFSTLGAALVAYNGAPLAFKGPLNPNAEPYPQEG